MFGLKDSDLDLIVATLNQFPEIERGVIFGSRAKGTYKAGSDIDIALFGQGIDTAVSEISAFLNEKSPLPYFFDIVDYNKISNKDLIEHIDRYGKVFYLSSQRT